MPGPQFLHYECYGLHLSKKATKKTLSIRGVMAEACREPNACPHVPMPTPPTLLYGVQPADVETLCERIGNTAKDASGRKMRKDASILVAGVVSWPQTWEDADPATVQRWAEESTAFLKRRWGEALRSVVLHTDEDRPHLHFYAVADHQPGARYSIDSISPAHAAQSAAKQAGGDRKAQKTAFNDTMRAMQDQYSAEVGVDFGLTRHGPRRRRLTRAEWVAEREAAELVARQRAETRIAHDQAQQDRGAALSVRSAAESDRAAAAETLEAASSERDALVRERAETAQERAQMAQERSTLRALADEARALLEAMQARFRPVADALEVAWERWTGGGAASKPADLDPAAMMDARIRAMEAAALPGDPFDGIGSRAESMFGLGDKPAPNTTATTVASRLGGWRDRQQAAPDLTEPRPM